MAALGTKIADILYGEVFLPYTIQRTTEKSAFVQSGIIVPDPQMDALASAGGKYIDLPFFNDLTGADEVLSDNALGVGKIGAVQDMARLHMRGKAWGVTDMAKAISGDDPMKAIAELVSDYWVRREQDLLFSSLTGVFRSNAATNAGAVAGSTDSEGHSNVAGDLISDVSVTDAATATAANLIGPDAVIDATAKLGDCADKLVAIAMHSVPFARLKKLNLIDNVPDATNNINIPYYLGLRVIVDDGITPTACTNGFKYTTYLFGGGAIARGNGNAPVGVETDRDSLVGEDYLIHRRHFVLHPRGIKWLEGSFTPSNGSFSPTNSECALAVNWGRVYCKKNIRIVKMITNG